MSFSSQVSQADLIKITAVKDSQSEFCRQRFDLTACRNSAKLGQTIFYSCRNIFRRASLVHIYTYLAREYLL